MSFKSLLKKYYNRLYAYFKQVFAKEAAQQPVPKPVPAEPPKPAPVPPVVEPVPPVEVPKPEPKPENPPAQASGYIYGLTLDDVSGLKKILPSLVEVGGDRRLTTRVVLDYGQTYKSYESSLKELGKVSDILACVVDSSDMKKYTLDSYKARVLDFVGCECITYLEIGNEINGDWLGSGVPAKLEAAFQLSKAAGKKTFLTLYHGLRGENEMFTWAEKNISKQLKLEVDVVGVSFYAEDSETGIPSTAEWNVIFDKLRVMFPYAKLCFAEVGLTKQATASTAAKAASVVNVFYPMKITTDGYVGGHFYWYYAEDYKFPEIQAALKAAIKNMP